ncbi:MAG: hypothetical protein KGV44_13360 [Flavobacteriaceae bacterium]|nr:hypothetical protein [Flavobacteriaceae bacterium]
MKRKLLFRTLFLALCCLGMIAGATAQNTTGSAIQATGGVGKYKESIYWMTFGREMAPSPWAVQEGSKFQNGDKSVFTTKSGVKYTVTITNIRKIGGTNDYIHAISTEYKKDVWPGGNNFPYAYNFDDENGNPVFSDETAVAIRAAAKTEMAFRLEIEAQKPNPLYDPKNPGNAPEFLPTTANVVLAGSESLGRPNEESYSLTSPIETEHPVSHQNEPSKIGVIETFMSRREDAMKVANLPVNAWTPGNNYRFKTS